MPTPIAEGTQAPPIRLPSDIGEEVDLAAQVGDWVVVFFYPRAMTSGCTKEACGFRDVLSEIRELGAVVWGVSDDPQDKLGRFRDRHGLSFPLLSDMDHRVSEAYGVYGVKKTGGKERMGVHRMTFLINPRGVVAKVWQRVKPADHAAEVLEELQTRTE